MQKKAPSINRQECKKEERFPATGFATSKSKRIGVHATSAYSVTNWMFD